MVATMHDAHALVIGIATYQFLNALPTAVVQDAQDVAQVLVHPQSCGYPPGNVRLLLNEHATLTAIRSELQSLSDRSTAQSTVFLYFSGHGGSINAGPHTGAYLLPFDADYNSDQALAATALSGQEFTRTLHSIPAARLVLILDCCHAGGIGRPKSSHISSFKMGLSEAYYDLLKHGQGWVIIASSRETELSWILPGAANSLFTQHLLAGLKGGASRADGVVRVFDLFEYVQLHVTQAHPQQHPIFKAEFEENFPIALSFAVRQELGLVARAGDLKFILAPQSEGWALVVENVGIHELTHITVTLAPPATLFLNTTRLSIPRLSVGARSVPHLINIKAGGYVPPPAPGSGSLGGYAAAKSNIYSRRQAELERKIEEMDQCIAKLEKERDVESGLDRKRLDYQIQQQRNERVSYEQEFDEIACKLAELNSTQPSTLASGPAQHEAVSAAQALVNLPFSVVYRVSGKTSQRCEGTLQGTL